MDSHLLSQGCPSPTSKACKGILVWPTTARSQREGAQGQFFHDEGRKATKNCLLRLFYPQFTATMGQVWITIFWAAQFIRLSHEGISRARGFSEPYEEANLCRMFQTQLDEFED